MQKKEASENRKKGRAGAGGRAAEAKPTCIQVTYLSSAVVGTMA
jgi:hypothetical protein